MLPLLAAGCGSGSGTSTKRPRPENRVAVAQHVTQTLASAAFPGARITVGPDGSGTTITVPLNEVCLVPLDAQRTVLRQIHQLDRSLREVRLLIAGSGQPVIAYAAAHCKLPPFPAMSGAVLYAHSGTTDVHFVTPRLFVRAQRWTVQYVVSGRYLSIAVLHGSKLLRPVIARLAPGVGSQEFTGTGTYTLVVAGAGDWKVRVIGNGAGR